MIHRTVKVAAFKARQVTHLVRQPAVHTWPSITTKIPGALLSPHLNKVSCGSKATCKHSPDTRSSSGSSLLNAEGQRQCKGILCYMLLFYMLNPCNSAIPLKATNGHWHWLRCATQACKQSGQEDKEAHQLRGFIQLLRLLQVKTSKEFGGSEKIGRIGRSCEDATHTRCQ